MTFWLIFFFLFIFLADLVVIPGGRERILSFFLRVNPEANEIKVDIWASASQRVEPCLPPNIQIWTRPQNHVAVDEKERRRAIIPRGSVCSF